MGSQSNSHLQYLHSFSKPLFIGPEWESWLVPNNPSTSWCCRLKWGSSCVKHEHHVVPRAFGGSDGPVVCICTSHHDLLHRVARLMVSETDYAMLLSDLPLGVRNRVVGLAVRAALSEILFQEHPHRRVPVHLTLPKWALNRIKDIANSRNTTQQDLIESLLIELAKKGA